MFDLFADEHEVKMQMVREDPPQPQPGISIRPAGR
jgi:hypothetical protein